jgi:hypothetical protein
MLVRNPTVWRLETFNTFAKRVRSFCPVGREYETCDCQHSASTRKFALETRLAGLACYVADLSRPPIEHRQ